MHRYIPVLAKNAGFVGEKVVQHQARKYGKLNLGWNVSLMDSYLITIWFLSRFGKDQCIYLVQWDR
jgi:hypothetical protein